MISSIFAYVAGLLGLASAPADHAERIAGSAFDEPRLFAPEALAQEGRITLSPGFAPDGRTLYFAQADCRQIWKCPQRLMRSRLGPGGWSKATSVALLAQGRVDWPSVSPDGQRLLFSWAVPRARHEGRNVYEDFDLYSLDLGDPAANPSPLDEPDINRIRGGAIRKTRFVNNETAPSLTEDGDLYFWTERLDGIGLRDVYLAEADGNGGYEKARPLPSPINSPGEDDGMWVRPDGRLMLMSYSDRGGEGSSDIFVSVKSGAQWSDPVALGAAVNSPHADFAGRVTPDGRYLVFTSNRPQRGEGAGLYQVWHLPVDRVPALTQAIARADLAQKIE